jgi:light-regulated signal transduction histidine kinase (bacteriophytochrome)
VIQTTDERLENALKEIEKLKALADSCNQELQHFVYAASHDLQEPLRAVTTYSQLLERMYADDEQAKELTAFIVSGVARMNELLQNLVSYSRIGASKTRAEVRLMAPLQAALYKLSAEVKETGADSF